jgi:hypothetical protein
MYCANPVRAAEDAMTGGQLAMIITPKQGNRLPAGVTWVADNGCGPGKHGIGAGFPGEDAYIGFLRRHADKAADCLFACAPDVVGDAAATLARSRPMFARIRDAGYRVAYVLQDGQELVPVPWDEIDAVFIGGSTEFKLGEVARGLVAEAKARGLHVHMGRVNSRKRLRYAAEIGCDTADGTYLVFGPDKNLPKLLSWLGEIAAEAAEAAEAAGPAEVAADAAIAAPVPPVAELDALGGGELAPGTFALHVQAAPGRRARVAIFRDTPRRWATAELVAARALAAGARVWFTANTAPRA